MSEKYIVKCKKNSDQKFLHTNISGTVFEGIDLSGAKFFNINLRDAKIGAIYFGGSSLSCMNTGEGHPRKPAVFNSIELDDCSIQNSFFRNTKIVNCSLTGMTIDGIRVTNMVKAYETLNSKSQNSGLPNTFSQTHSQVSFTPAESAISS